MAAIVSVFFDGLSVMVVNFTRAMETGYSSAVRMKYEFEQRGC